MSEGFSRGVVMNVEESESVQNVEERDFTEEQNKVQLRLHEDDIIQGLLDASDYVTDETLHIEIARNGRVYFAFDIRPLSEEEYNKCKKKYTKYVRNKQLGVKMPEETNTVKYRNALIHTATVEKDREQLWDNKKVWEALRNKGLQIMNGLDVIEYCLKAGEKEKVLEQIDLLSGYEENIEEVVKN